MENNNNSVTLFEWVLKHHSDSELRSVFLNMDKALKYIHNHGYYIEVFYPDEIYVLYDKDNYIYFNKTKKFDEGMKQEQIRRDLYRSAVVQIGIYTNTLEYLQSLSMKNNIKENFDLFTELLPFKEDVAYYRGIIQRDASVYFCEFNFESKKREFQQLQQEVGSTNEVSELNLNPSEEVMTNKKVNDVIYYRKMGEKEAAFLNILIIPLLIGIVSIIFSIITIVISFSS